MLSSQLTTVLLFFSSSSFFFILFSLSEGKLLFILLFLWLSTLLSLGWGVAVYGPGDPLNCLPAEASLASGAPGCNTSLIFRNSVVVWIYTEEFEDVPLCCRVLRWFPGRGLWCEDIHCSGYPSCCHCWATGQAGTGHQSVGQGAAQPGTDNAHLSTATDSLQRLRGQLLCSLWNAVWWLRSSYHSAQ